MTKTPGKKIPLDRVINISEELSPDDIEVGQMDDLQALIEEKDDYSPDDLQPGMTPITKNRPDRSSR